MFRLTGWFPFHVFGLLRHNVTEKVALCEVPTVMNQNTCKFLSKTRIWCMPNELGLNYACSRKVKGMFEESIKTVEDYDKKVLR